MAPRSLFLYLDDIRQACLRVSEFAAGKTLHDYKSDAFFRSAVERQLMIIGEALRGATRQDPAVVARLPESGRIIAFRNILVHQYFGIEDDIVWVIITKRVPELLAVVLDLLNEGSSDETT